MPQQKSKGEKPGGKSAASPSTSFKDTRCWKYFNAILDKTLDTEISKEDIIKFATEELQIDYKNLPEPLKTIFPDFVISFMNLWSGWFYKTEYLAGKFTREHYFTRFHKYMSYKPKFLLRNQNLVCINDFAKAATGYTETGEKGPQKPSKHSKQVGPIVLNIQCVASMVNTLGFSSSKDALTMKQHSAPSWSYLNMIQMINWPFVEVTFRSDNLTFIRRQATDFNRFLSYNFYDEKQFVESDVEDIKVHPGEELRKCYSIPFLKAYATEIEKLFKANGKMADKYNEIQAILGQFLQDAKQININNSVATHTTIRFRLSKAPFMRNKKFRDDSYNNSEVNRVNYCEVIWPKIELKIGNINIQQMPCRNQEDIRFVNVEEMKKTDVTNLYMFHIPAISYRCTYCNVIFNSVNAFRRLVHHLHGNHSMETPVRCTICRKQCDVASLAYTRWAHKCQET